MAGNRLGEQLPRGRHALTRDQVAENQRRRLLGAVPPAVRAKGFASLTVEDIASRARVSRRTFYENFRDVEDCFVASYREHADDLLAVVARGAAAGADWQERTQQALTALLRHLAQRPDVAHMAMIEVLAGGPVALAERDRAIVLLGSLIGDEALQATPDPAPRLLLEVLSGATLQLIYARVLVGATRQLEELLPTIMYMVLVALLGPARAAARAGLVSDGTASGGP